MQTRASSQQIETLERERVFLTLVEVGDKRLTVDPDTQAVIDLRFLKHRISCLNNGLTCYFDRLATAASRLLITQAGAVLHSGRDPGPTPCLRVWAWPMRL